jgi:hypothetical protein|nr:MAG TPA: hypothetical protein [Caudoviricetes sp.]
MAKQKYELLPDKVVAANAETIKAIGHIATDTDIVDYVSGQLMRDYIKIGKKTLDEAAKLTEQTIMSDDFLDKLGAIKNMVNWYYSGRQIYVFDDDFASLLSGQGTADLKISADVFKQLPCNCFYIQRKYKNSVGFFFDLQGDRMTMTEYFFDNVEKDYYSESIAIELQYDMTVEDLIYKILGSYVKKDMAGTKAMICDIAEKLQFIVYLSAVNAEIAPITKHQAQKKSTAQRPQKPSAQPQKSAIANVGYRIGVAVRKHRQAENAVGGQHSPQGHSAPKAPHIRRAHFHGYHTNGGYQVKWLSTIFVNADRDDNDISTIHKVLQ